MPCDNRSTCFQRVFGFQTDILIKTNSAFQDQIHIDEKGGTQETTSLLYASVALLQSIVSQQSVSLLFRSYHLTE
jgi:hypothetical protein